MIEEILYAMYQIDWMHMHMITAERKLDAIRRYSDEVCKEHRDGYSFDNYLNEFGYDGELYACFDEFLDCEFRNKAYMKQLCDNDKLYAEYLTRLEEI